MLLHNLHHVKIFSGPSNDFFYYFIIHTSGFWCISFPLNNSIKFYAVSELVMITVLLSANKLQLGEAETKQLI